MLHIHFSDIIIFLFKIKLMQSLQILDKRTDDNIPIILLDYSGSTMAPFYDQKRVIDHFADLIKQVMQYDNFDKASIILFSDEAFNAGLVTIDDLNIYKLIEDSKLEPAGTNLIPALHLIDKLLRCRDQYYHKYKHIVNKNKNKNKNDSDSESEDDEVLEDSDEDVKPKKRTLPQPNEIIPTYIIDPNKKTPIYIFTDGVADDSEEDLLKAINNTFGLEKGSDRKNVDLRMIILESNDKNYCIENCETGNALTKTFRNSNLTDLLKYVFFFNRRYRSFNDRFVNMYNAVLPNEYIQYDDKCFYIKYYPIFLANITKEITDLRDQLTCDDDDDNNNNDNDNDNDNKIPKEDMINDVVNKLIKGGDISNNRNLKNDHILGRLEKIGYNLIKTIRDLEKASKDNKNFNKRQMIDFFCNIIGVDSITDYLRRDLIYGVDNKTFQEYKTKRGKTFNKTQINMYTNLQKSFGNTTLNMYTSFLENGCIYDIDSFDIEHSINLGFREYKHAGVYDIKNKRLVPILPIQQQIEADRQMYISRQTHQTQQQQINQVIRQWIRANYSKRYGIPVNSDLLHYVFLLDNLYIQCSELPIRIKNTYNWYASIMLGRMRYNESIQEKTYLIKGEPPKPVDSKEDFRDFLPQCPNYVRMINSDGEVFDPMTVWFMMLAVLENNKTEGILTAQLKHCPDIVTDGVLPVPYDDFIKQCSGNNIKAQKQNVCSGIKKKIKDLTFDKPETTVLKRIRWIIGQFKNIDYKCIKLKIDPAKIIPNYYCYITLSDTSDTGGYMFYPHTKIIKHNDDNDNNNDIDLIPIAQKIICHPNYVISSEAYNSYNKLGQINNGLQCPHCGAKVNPSLMTQIESKDEYDQREDVVSNEKELKKMYCKVEIYDNFSDRLIELNRLDFRVNYRHRVFFREHIVLANPTDGFGVMRFETPDKQTEFNKKVPKFLLDLDWQNIAVAGGMCRSILLGQKIQDIDIFFVGLDEEGIKLRVVELINNTVSVLQQENPDYRFILMYKPLNSVIEILCTLSTFDENSIDPDDEKLDNMNIDEKFLFIHNEIVHKIQIILKEYEDINDIFENFDMYPSCVAFDGKKTYFNEASYVSYRYMVNMVDKEKSTHESYDYRIMKYYKYGFSLALDKKQLNDSLITLINGSPKMIKISGCVFELIDRPTVVDDIDDRYIMLNSFKLAKKGDKITKSENDLETNIVKDKALYVSFDGDTALDTHMIGLYNYMAKENIRYCYLMGPTNEDELEDVFNVDQINFLKNRRIGDYDWYDDSRIIIAN